MSNPRKPNDRDREHPENDLLYDDADFANRRPPEPRSAEELAQAGDPAERAARNRASTRQAIRYLIGSIVATILVALALGVIARLMGGPLCEAGEETWLCTEASQVWWPIGASLTPVIAIIGCGVIMVRKLNAYLRWRPWMGVFWALVPFTMAWLTWTLGRLALTI